MAPGPTGRAGEHTTQARRTVRSVVVESTDDRPAYIDEVSDDDRAGSFDYFDEPTDTDEGRIVAVPARLPRQRTGKDQRSHRHKAPKSRRRRRRADRLTPQRRRRRKLIRRGISALLAAVLLLIGISVGRALSAPGSSSAEARLAEWGRGHGLGSVVTWLENEQYNAHPPKVGGTLSPDELQQLQPPSATPTLGTGQKVLPPITPFVTADAVPHEGEWEAAVVVNGVPVVQTAKLRSDPEHTGYLSAVAWIDQKHAKFVLHPGSQEPGGSGWGETPYITKTELPGLIAAWNGAFRVTNGDAHGGVYLNGKTAKTLKAGQASEVFMKDGSIAIGSWGQGPDMSMTPDVVGVRQNLTLLVDNGQVNPDVDSSDPNLWGVTVKNAYYVWRSGVGITADGNIVYAMGPALSVRTLAELLQRAGAVRGMELDINSSWVSFMSYDGSKDPANPVPTKLLPNFDRSANRYLSTDERDFVAVYAR